MDARLNQPKQKEKIYEKYHYHTVLMGAVTLAALVMLLHLFPHVMGILLLLALIQVYRMLRPMINPG